jgi:hypothetical protein
MQLEAEVAVAGAGAAGSSLGRMTAVMSAMIALSS